MIVISVDNSEDTVVIKLTTGEAICMLDALIETNKDNKTANPSGISYISMKYKKISDEICEELKRQRNKK